jgi:hypothetical protein
MSEPSQQRRLVRLRDRYGTTSRMTRWRLRNEPGFPLAVRILGTSYYYEDELQMFEESRRDKARPAETGNAGENASA